MILLSLGFQASSDSGIGTINDPPYLRNWKAQTQIHECTDILSIEYLCVVNNLHVNIPITASACYGYEDKGVMIAAANEDLWEGGAACGKYFQVTCTGGTNLGTPHPCTDSPIVTVMITDFCPPPGCKGDLDLSHESFSAIADPAAGGIKISYQQWELTFFIILL